MKQARTIRETCRLTDIFHSSFRTVILMSRRRVINRLIYRRSIIKRKIGLEVSGKWFPVTLYTGVKEKTRPVVIFLSGSRAFSWKKQQLNLFARALAVIGYHFIVVDNSIHDDLTIEAGPGDFIKGLIESVTSNKIFDSDRIILAASDFSARLIYSFMNDKKSMEKIRAIFLLAPVSDIPALVRFAFTGRTRYGNHWIYRPSSANVRLLYLYNILGQYLDPGKKDRVSDVFCKLLNNNTTEAFETVRSLDRETRQLILSVYRGDMVDKDIDDIVNIDNKYFADMFLPEVPAKDIEIPVFIFHSILDRDVDCGQSQILFEKLNSSAGIYLHFSDYFSSEKYRSIFPSPARWFRGAFRLTVALYKLLAEVYSKKNRPYNPTKEPLRFKI